MPKYVVMVDIQFLGIYVDARDESEANQKALDALDHLPDGGVAAGVEYGLRGTKVLLDEEAGESHDNS